MVRHRWKKGGSTLFSPCHSSLSLLRTLYGCSSLSRHEGSVTIFEIIFFWLISTIRIRRRRTKSRGTILPRYHTTIIYHHTGGLRHTRVTKEKRKTVVVCSYQNLLVCYYLIDFLSETNRNKQTNETSQYPIPLVDISTLSL